MESPTYQEERWSQVVTEIAALLPAHIAEIAEDTLEHMPLAMDYAVYDTLEKAGVLHVETARVCGALAGYVVTLVGPHPRFSTTVCGAIDLYYVLPAYRTCGVGRTLFQAAEAALKRRGVTQLFTGTKSAHDHGALLNGLGWHATETLYTRWIGERPGVPRKEI